MEEYRHWCEENLPGSAVIQARRPQHFLYFLPLPHGQGAFGLALAGTRIVELSRRPSKDEGETPGRPRNELESAESATGGIPLAERSPF